LIVSQRRLADRSKIKRWVRTSRFQRDSLEKQVGD
jgi:hypothetical protein